MSKFIEHSVITFFTKILQSVLGIGTSIIIARILGPSGKGIYALVILLPTLIVSFGNMGIGLASVFYIGKKKYSVEEIFKNNTFLSLILGAIGISLGLIIIFLFGSQIFKGLTSNYLLFALILIPLQFFVSFVNHILLGLQEIRKYNFINIIQSLIFTVLIIIFLLVYKLGILSIIIAQIISILSGCIILFLLIKNFTKNFHWDWRLNKNYLKNCLTFGFKFYLSNMISFWHQRVDMLLINVFLNPMAVGFYSISVKLAEQLEIIHRSVGTVLFPRVASEKNDENLKEFTPFVCRNTLFITTIISILLFFFGRWIIILLYSQKFLNAVQPFQILLIGMVIMSGWGIMANDLHGRGKPELNIFINFISLATNITLNIIWIPKYGLAGVAWATAISYTLAFIVTMIIYSKISGNKIKDMLFLKKSDLKVYKNFVLSFKNKCCLYKSV